MSTLPTLPKAAYSLDLHDGFPTVAYSAQQMYDFANAAIAAISAPQEGWVPLTDGDRDRAFQTLPDMLEGFMKKWGWLHYAKAIEAVCREKNAPIAARPQARSDGGRGGKA